MDNGSVLISGAVLLAAVIIGMILWKTRKKPSKKGSRDSPEE
jgi:hypothetical protein